MKRGSIKTPVCSQSSDCLWFCSEVCDPQHIMCLECLCFNRQHDYAQDSEHTNIVLHQMLLAWSNLFIHSLLSTSLSLFWLQHWCTDNETELPTTASLWAVVTLGKEKEKKRGNQNFSFKSFSKFSYSLTRFSYSFFPIKCYGFSVERKRNCSSIP